MEATVTPWRSALSRSQERLSPAWHLLIGPGIYSANGSAFPTLPLPKDSAPSCEHHVHLRQLLTSCAEGLHVALFTPPLFPVLM